MKVRQDAWSEEDDLLLAETVLRHIREGSTQLTAFDEVGDALNRTSAACGFRWNAVVRNKYNDAIKLAKKHRKERKRQQANEAKPATFAPVQKEQKHYDPYVPNVTNSYSQDVKVDNEMTLQNVIEFLQTLNGQGHKDKLLVQENEALKLENNELQQKVNELEKTLAKLEQEHKVIEEDYQSIIGIMNRARRMALLDEDQEERANPAFRMDKNGNLEKLAK